LEVLGVEVLFEDDWLVEGYWGVDVDLVVLG